MNIVRTEGKNVETDLVERKHPKNLNSLLSSSIICIESITRKVIRTHKNSRRLIFVSSFIFVCVKILKSSRGILQPRKTVCSTSGTIQFKRPRATIERRRTKEEGTERIMRNEPSGKLLILISRSRWIESAKT